MRYIIISCIIFVLLIIILFCVFANRREHMSIVPTLINKFVSHHIYFPIIQKDTQATITIKNKDEYHFKIHQDDVYTYVYMNAPEESYSVIPDFLVKNDNQYDGQLTIGTKNIPINIYNIKDNSFDFKTLDGSVLTDTKIKDFDLSLLK